MSRGQPRERPHQAILVHLSIRDAKFHFPSHKGGHTSWCGIFVGELVPYNEGMREHLCPKCARAFGGRLDD